MATLKCRFGASIDLKRRQGHDYRIAQGADTVFVIEILDSAPFNWAAYTPRSELRRNFRDKAPEVLGRADVSKLNDAPGANKTFFWRLPFDVSDAFRAAVGSWDLEMWHENSVLRPVSESVWQLSFQTTE